MAITRNDKDTVIKEFGKSPEDTGSTQVQIALLTKSIRELTEHCKLNPHDFSSKRGLLKMVCRRRRFLHYLEQSDNTGYKKIIEQLGLRK